jgi:hypothetical protein
MCFILTLAQAEEYDCSGALMFERFTEPARFAIFYARFEAQMRNSEWIETEHILHGLFYKDESSPQDSLARAKVPASHGDIPLSADAKQALAYAAEEAESRGSSSIDIRHLVLGLLRLPDSPAALALNRLGITYDEYHSPPAADSILKSIAALEAVVRSSDSLIYTDEYGDQRLKRKPWTRKEALGHLIDLATNRHQLFARALTEPVPIVSTPVSEEWVAVQNYRDYSWPRLIDLWVSLNQLLIHVLSKMPEDKLNTPCRVGIDEPIALKDVITRYITHCEDIIGQILARL